MSEVMREYVSRKYGKKWVESKPDYQIACIYRRMLDAEENKLRKRRKEESHGTDGKTRQ